MIVFSESQILWQECATVKSIIYDTPYSRIRSETISMAIELYSRDLEQFAFHGLPRFHMPKHFSERADTSLVNTLSTLFSISLTNLIDILIEMFFQI